MLIVDRQDDSTDHEKRACSGRGFQTYLYIYSCMDNLEVHRYLSVLVE